MSNLETRLEDLLKTLDTRIERALDREDAVGNAFNAFEATSLPSPRNDARLDRWSAAYQRAIEIRGNLEERREATKALFSVLEQQRWDREKRQRERKRALANKA